MWLSEAWNLNGLGSMLHYLLQQLYVYVLIQKSDKMPNQDTLNQDTNSCFEISLSCNSSLVPRPHPQMGKGLVTFERFLGCAVSAERMRLHTVQYVLCHMRAVWLSHDC